jgi:ParB-like chromosome segregation protein Spo0J
MEMIEKNIPIEEIIDDFDKWYGTIKKECEQMEKLKEDISKNGLKRRLFVRSQGNFYEVIDGLHRLRALNKLGWKEVPCVVVAWGVQAKPHPRA